MAATRGVLRLFGSCMKPFSCSSNLPKAPYVSLLKDVPGSRQFPTTYTLLNKLPYNIHNRNASTAVKKDEGLLGCPICSKNLKFTYKDVLLLAQFISPEGNILNRRITGVCRKQQRKLEKSIEISRRMGLIPRKPPALTQKQSQTS